MAPPFTHVDMEWSWAAGLFAGEGHARCIFRGPYNRGYPQISLKMLDQHCAERFGEVVQITTYRYRYHVDPTRFVYQVQAAGGAAGAAFNGLLPYLRDTDKETQVVRAFIDAEWTLQNGVWVAPTGRRAESSAGHRHSQETKERMRASAFRRWASSR